MFFSEFQLEGCCDFLTIYDGETVGSPILIPGSNGTSLLDQTFYASPENETGALTITFTSMEVLHIRVGLQKLVVQIMLYMVV
ncbi:MAG: hypothetical protein CM15mP107_3740 [Bacteroidota bacterium]|nr:MAG: hypothetical protein CM15mP107_3740 [Bacteroidota bacterium]